MKKLAQFEGASALLGAAFIYGTFGLLIREMSKMMGDAMQVAVRFILAAALIVVVNLLMRKKFRLSQVSTVKAILLGVSFAVVVLLFTISVNSTKIANSVFLLYAGSIFSSFLIGTFLLKEKVGPAKIVAIVITLVGLSMYSGAFLAASLGIVTGFASGLLDGVSNALRKSLKTVDRNVAVMYQYGVGSLVGVFAVLLAGDFAFGPVSLLPVLATAVFVVLMLFLSNLLLFGFQHFDVNIGTVILATELFFAAIFGYIFLQESPTVQEMIGGILIFIASIIAAVDIPRLLCRRSA